MRSQLKTVRGALVTLNPDLTTATSLGEAAMASMDSIAHGRANVTPGGYT